MQILTLHLQHHVALSKQLYCHRFPAYLCDKFTIKNKYDPQIVAIVSDRYRNNIRYRYAIKR